MTATATRITCDACGRDLTDPDEQRTGLCTDDLARWFAEACAVAPRTFHPTSHDINRIVAKHTAIGSAIRAVEREADDFEDLDDTGTAPLPASSWWDMSDGERETATKRQQTGMAGDVS